MWPQMIIPPNPIQKNYTSQTRFCLCCTILSIRTTPRKPLFLRNSSNLFLVSAPFVTWNYKKYWCRRIHARHYSHIQRYWETPIQPKPAGPDQIKPIVLKNLSTPLSPILKHLFQKLLDSGTLPPIWKDANVAPVYKKGEHSNPDNYRPKSLTCIFCKTLEHIVASYITKHI